jgi:hypothetical protein
MSLIVNENINVEVRNNIIKIPDSVGRIKKIQFIFYSNNFFKSDLTPVDEYTRLFKTETYIVSNANANVFNLTYPVVGVNMFYYKYFNNEKIVVTGKKLSWHEGNSVFEMK